MYDRLYGVYVCERELDVVHGRCVRSRLGRTRRLLLLLEIPVARQLLDGILVLLLRLPSCGGRHDAGDCGDLRYAGCFGGLGRDVRTTLLQCGLIREAAFAAERVLEGDEQQEADADNDCEEPERCPPVEALGEDAAENGPE